MVDVPRWLPAPRKPVLPLFTLIDEIPICRPFYFYWTSNDCAVQFLKYMAYIVEIDIIISKITHVYAVFTNLSPFGVSYHPFFSKWYPGRDS